MLLLVVMTIFALSMFRSFGLQEKIAGNVREKQRALQAAEGAQQYAEVWLSNLTTTTPAEVPCSGVQAATPAVVQICSGVLSAVVTGGVTTVPWIIGGTPTGFSYNPNNAMSVSSTAGANTYAGLPQFYISDLGVSASGTGEVYQIDAWGYASNTGTVAVVESTYVVMPTVKCLSC
jgi:type IV pilus assembly protein PilX